MMLTLCMVRIYPLPFPFPHPPPKSDPNIQNTTHPTGHFPHCLTLVSRFIRIFNAHIIQFGRFQIVATGLWHNHLHRYASCISIYTAAYPIGDRFLHDIGALSQHLYAMNWNCFPFLLPIVLQFILNGKVPILQEFTSLMHPNTCPIGPLDVIRGRVEKILHHGHFSSLYGNGFKLSFNCLLFKQYPQKKTQLIPVRYAWCRPILGPQIQQCAQLIQFPTLPPQ